MQTNSPIIKQSLFFFLLVLLTVGTLFSVDYYFTEEKSAPLTEAFEGSKTAQKSLTNKSTSPVQTDPTPLAQVQNKKEASVQPNIPDEIETEPYVLKESAWVPTWDLNEALYSLNQNPNHFDNLLPVWYSINTDGTLISRKTHLDIQLMNFAEQNDILIIPTISSFESATIKAVLSNDENYQRHLDSILHEVRVNDYDGIDLDYEVIELSEKNAYLKLIRDLSAALHAEEKVLSVTVLSKWSNFNIYSAFPETRQSQDWSEIAKYADYVRIMAYDYTTASSPNPGPIGPIDWQVSILNYAVQHIPKEKIWLGVHLYGYEWSEQGKSGASTYRDFNQNVLAIPEVQVSFDEKNKEGFATYPCYEDDSCTLYFMTPEGVDARRELAEQYGIAGLSYWRLGKDDNILY